MSQDFSQFLPFIEYFVGRIYVLKLSKLCPYLICGFENQVSSQVLKTNAL